MVNSSDHRRWFKELEEIKPPIPELVHKNELTAPLVISKVAKKVREKFGNNFLVVTDVGQHQMWTAQHMAVDRPNTFLSSGGLGAMGYGLPASIGAKMARPTETVILICGDGGLQMNIQELITLLQEEISIKIFVINNAYLGMVRQWQELFYGKNYASTKLHNPHFVKVAQAYGLEAKAVDKPELLEDAIDSVLDHKGPTLLECKVKSEDNVYPMIKPGAGLKDIIIGRR